MRLMHAKTSRSVEIDVIHELDLVLGKMMITHLYTLNTHIASL